MRHAYNLLYCTALFSYLSTGYNTHYVGNVNIAIHRRNHYTHLWFVALIDLGRNCIAFNCLTVTLFDLNRAVCGAIQRHNATDIQEKEILVQSGFLQPPEKRTRKAFWNPEVCDKTGQKTAGCDARPHRCTGELLLFIWTSVLLSIINNVYITFL